MIKLWCEINEEYAFREEAFQWGLPSWICIMMLCRISFTLPFLKYNDKLIAVAHISIKMWFLCGIKVAFQTLSNERQNLVGSNKANLVLILRNPSFFFWRYSEDSASISLGLHYQARLCACWGGLTVMCSVIQIVIRLFRIWIPTSCLSLHRLSVCVSFPAIPPSSRSLTGSGVLAISRTWSSLITTSALMSR